MVPNSVNPGEHAKLSPNWNKSDIHGLALPTHFTGSFAEVLTDFSAYLILSLLFPYQDTQHMISVL